MSGEIISDPNFFSLICIFYNEDGLLMQTINERGRSMSMLRKDFGGLRDRGREICIWETKETL